MRIGSVVVLLVACAWAGGCAAGKGKGASSGGGNHPLLRQVAPDSEVKLQSGPSWKPANASGKVLVIDFWATWCGPCKDSFPKLDAIYKKHGGRGLEVVGINEDEDPKGIPSFVQQTGATFPIALDPDGNMATTYNVGTMPSEFVLDRHGVVRYVHSGYHPEDMEALEEEVAELLREPP
jgi:cytochrome c biogenesis protein CcmG/thiol:disulfide interchange protein DsbE